MLRKIHPSHQPKAVFLLQLLLVYGESVELNALVDALAINIATKSFDESDRMPRPMDILTLCPGLVELAEKREPLNKERVQFAHYSVKEYLQSDRILPQLGKDFMHAISVRNTVKASLIYLMKLPMVNDGVHLDYPRPWIRYATTIFVAYAREVEDEDAWITESFCRFLLGKGHVYSRWFQYIGQGVGKFTIAYTDCPLHFAALIGMSKCVKMMLQSQANHSTSSALDQAQHSTVTEMLLDYSSNASRFLNQLHKCSYTPLWIASRFGNAEAVESLLQDRQCILREQLDCGYMFSSNCKAAYIAASNGHVRIVQILLQHGVEGPPALMEAANAGDLKAVQLLLDCGVSVDSVAGKWKENALHIASRNARLGLVQLLLERHADPNFRDSSSRSALHEVTKSRSKRASFQIARLLLKYGAKLDSKDYRGSTPLIDAVENGHRMMVLLLLHKSASSSASSKRYDGAVQVAFYVRISSYPAAVRREVALLLRERGAEGNISREDIREQWYD